MSQLHLSDEILMAFADGELDEPVAAAVARAMAEDPAVAKRIVDFQQSRRLTRSAFVHAAASDVPPELHAAVLARIQAYEAVEGPAKPRPSAEQSGRTGGKQAFMTLALAASLAAVTLGVGYFAGRQSLPTQSLWAQLDAPSVRYELSRAESGRDVVLPTGRMRVISTFRSQEGLLCREFRYEAASNAADAVACRTGEWNVNFAVARAPKEAEYVPSGGADPVDAYLQSIGAGQPLVEGDEVKALAGAPH